MNHRLHNSFKSNGEQYLLSFKAIALFPSVQLHTPLGSKWPQRIWHDSPKEWIKLQYKVVKTGQGWWLMPVTPALQDAEVGGSPKVRSSRPACPTRWNLISTKNIKINWAWQQAPIIQATQEAKAGELLEPGRQRLQWAEITSLHSILGDCKKKKKNF